MGAEKLRQLCNELAHEGNSILAKDQLEHAKKFTETAVQAFYGTYDPIIYDRTNGLKTFAHPEIVGDKFIFNLGPKYYSGGALNPLAVYYWVFKKGYHGGAPSGVRTHWAWGVPHKLPHPNPGIPYWGTPDPWYSMWYPVPAPQSTPPFEILRKQWNSYVKGAYVKKKNEVQNMLIKKYASIIFKELKELGYE